MSKSNVTGHKCELTQSKAGLKFTDNIDDKIAEW